MSGGPPDQFGEVAARVDEAWEAEGRAGKPRKAALPCSTGVEQVDPLAEACRSVVAH
jgi:hypothetical protein